MGLVILGITFVGGRVIPWLLRYIAETRSRELFTLTVLVIVLGIALASANLFGVSMALGAFLAGVVVGQSDFSLRAASEALPMRDAFAVLFFVSVGMLFDPIVFFQSSQLLIGTLAIISIGTPLVSFLAILIAGYPLRSSTSRIVIPRADRRVLVHCRKPGAATALVASRSHARIGGSIYLSPFRSRHYCSTWLTR